MTYKVPKTKMRKGKKKFTSKVFSKLVRERAYLTHEKGIEQIYLSQK